MLKIGTLVHSTVNPERTGIITDGPFRLTGTLTIRDTKKQFEDPSTLWVVIHKDRRIAQLMPEGSIGEDAS